MTQDERWNKRYQDVMAFIETNKRNPSKHRIEGEDESREGRAFHEIIGAERTI